MAKITPVQELAPSLPEPFNPPQPFRIFGEEEVFGFDTETTTCGMKELRSYQAAFITAGKICGTVHYLKNWYSKENVKQSKRRIESLLSDVKLAMGTVTFIEYPTLDALRTGIQILHEDLIYGGQPRVERRQKKRGVGLTKWRRTKRTPLRLACAFNANFDLGVMADATILEAEMSMGNVESSGCTYYFTSGRHQTQTQQFGLHIKCLFMGADHVPTIHHSKRGELWDIHSAAKYLWNARTLAGVGRWIGIRKLEADFQDAAYGFLDAVITMKAANQLTADLIAAGFTGKPDRFISGATVSKNLMSQHYTPFYLDVEQHSYAWPAYFGGMTGATKPEHVREYFHSVKYGDLDGAYSSSGSMLEVFDWNGAEWITADEVKEILKQVKKDPMAFWKYGSLHIKVEGHFKRCPVRVAQLGNEDSIPRTTEGLVWAEMKEYSTTLTLGDYLHSEPQKHKIISGLIATKGEKKEDLFDLCSRERANFPKFDKEGNPIYKNWVHNTWFKLAGNCCYGALANRNGKDRMKAGQWFNVIMASSITGAIRHAMWLVNESGEGHYYNDTDSCLTSDFETAQKACKTIGIGFSNKTNEELKGCDEAAIAVIQGSKRYAMQGHDGTFGAKCHGLGSWYAQDPSDPTRAVPIAHNKQLLKTVWQCVYPELFGMPDSSIATLRMFHKFSIRSRRMSDTVKGYARRQFNLKSSELEPYGKAGNFGFISPNISEGKMSQMVSYKVEEAVELSNLNLQEVALIWQRGYDKKYDYANGTRWSWKGSDVKDVQPVDHSAELAALVNDVDVSIEINEAEVFEW